MEKPELHFEGIDLFAGAGGVTEGIERAEYDGKKIARVIAAINHDYYAIESHWKNHPQVKHFVEDIKTFNVDKLPEIISNDFTRTFIWASLECTNFSNAKGGLPRDPDSRTLADHLPRYIEKVNPDYIFIENVREFLAWGPLDKNGKPLSREKGKDFQRWVKKIKSYGYKYDHRILNAADFGAHTSRKRLFIIFAKEYLPIVFPSPTHSKDGKILPKWKPVKEVLDLSKKGKSIFGRKKNLSENTLKRIYEGLVKFIAKGDTAFLQQYNSGSDSNRVINIENPANTITTANRFSLIQPEFMIKYHGNGKNILSLNNPSSCLTTKDRMALIQSEFLVHHSSKVNDIDNPSPTIVTKDKLALIQTYFLDQQYGSSKPVSIDSPAGSLTTNPKFNLITVNPWIMDTQFQNLGKNIDEPLGTITANRKHFYLMNPQYQNKGASVDEPCFTLIARMDKKPPYLIITEFGELAIKIESEDSKYTRLIKQFMAAYGIIDIYMRMLTIDELKLITGFHYDYYLEGTQSQRKKYIGNAVPPVLAQKIFEAIYEANLELKTNFREAI